MSWKTVELGVICNISNGSTPLRTNKSFWEDGTVNWFTIEDIRKYGRVINQTTQFVTEKALKETSLKIVPIDTVLICCTASVGEYAITKIPLAMNQQFNGLILKTSDISPEFLYHYCSTIKEKLISVSGSTTINFVAISKLKKLKISYPPLSIQKNIVEKLDAIFSEIEKATATAKENSKNAEALFQSYLREVFEDCDDSYKQYQLGDICKIIGGGTPSKANPKFYEGEIPWATVRDMKDEIIKETDFKINEDAVSQSSTNIIPKNNVIIATRVGLGKVCIIENDTAINQDLRGVIPIKPNLIEVMYLFYWFKSIAKVIINSGRGATVHGVTLPFVKSLKIKVPDIDKQRSIVSKIQDIQSNINTLNSVTNKKIQELQLLKQSILQQAFSGGLTKE